MAQKEQVSRAEALSRLVADKGGTITYAGRLAIARQAAIDRVHLFDENNQFLGVDPAPLLPPALPTFKRRRKANRSPTVAASQLEDRAGLGRQLPAKDILGDQS